MLHNPKWDKGLLDLTKPSLKALSHILRHKELWPEGFKWYFGSCRSCAMGMAKILWEFKSTYPEHVAQGCSSRIRYITHRYQKYLLF